MPEITVTTADGERSIEIVGNVDDIQGVLEAHGFDPTQVEYDGPSEYVLRRVSDTDYQIEDPSGTTLFSETYQSPPAIPHGIAEDVVNHGEQGGSPAMHELRKMMFVGFRYVDSR